MADAAAAVLARLKNKANESGRTYQLCLQLFCQEEFLRRLEKSKYVDNLVLKGGLFIYAITDFDSRVTMDVDFLLWKVPNTPEQLKTVLEEIITVPAGNDFVTYEIKGIAPIAVTKKYAGIGASLVARIKNIRTPLNIDFSVGDMIVPKQEKRKIPTQLEDFTAPMINTYSLETTVAEKIDAILNLMEFSSRIPCERIGRYITECNAKNDIGLTLDFVRGISTDKEFIDTKANMDGVSLSNYKIVSPNEIAFISDTSRRGDKISRPAGRDHQGHSRRQPFECGFA